MEAMSNAEDLNLQNIISQFNQHILFQNADVVENIYSNLQES